MKKLHYVQVEPVEEYSDFSEFIAVDWDGVKRYYQCKASNKDYDHWRLSDLTSYKISARKKNYKVQILKTNMFLSHLLDIVV